MCDEAHIEKKIHLGAKPGAGGMVFIRDADAIASRSSLGVVNFSPCRRRSRLMTKPPQIIATDTSNSPVHAEMAVRKGRALVDMATLDEVPWVVPSERRRIAK